MTIKVSINDDIVELPQGCTVAQALQSGGFSCEGHAVAVNAEFVPRSQHDEHVLQSGDCVDVLAPVQGG